MRALLARLSNDQRLRFLAVGVVNTAVAYIAFVAFDHFLFARVPFGYLLSLAASYAIAITLAFVLYRRFVYRVTGHVIRDFLRFLSVYAVSITVNAVSLPVLVEVVGLPAFVAQAILVVVTTLISYVGHGKVSFRR